MLFELLIIFRCFTFPVPNLWAIMKDGPKPVLLKIRERKKNFTVST